MMIIICSNINNIDNVLKEFTGPGFYTLYHVGYLYFTLANSKHHAYDYFIHINIIDQKLISMIKFFGKFISTKFM